jgi:15-hydroxyprostaglandin dehydrogenase (NAD)
METNPLYTAAKHALVGLTRACGSRFLTENITVNCICPAFVPTSLCPASVLDIFPKEHITPMSTVMRAFDRFLQDDRMTGQTMELSLDNHYLRVQPEWANESQRWLGEDSKAFWDAAYSQS